MKKIRIHPSEWFNNNRFVLIFSLLLSISFWLIITMTATPETPRTITNIPVIIQETTPEGLVPFGEYSKLSVSVEVTGRRYVVASLTPGDINVTARITEEVTAGEKMKVQLNASKNNQFSSFTIREITPAEIEVFYDERVTREFEVEARVTLEPGVESTAVKGLTAETPTIADAGERIVSVEGPATEVSKIHRVVALARIEEELTKTDNIVSNIVLYDQYDNVIEREYTTIGFETAMVTIPISKIKRVKIQPTFQNVPGQYADAPLRYSLSESEVEVMGPPEVIDALSSIELYPINFSEIYPGSYKFMRQLRFPSLVKSSENLQEVEVAIDLSEFTSKTVTVAVDQFIYVNRPENTDVTGTPVNTVMIIGPQESLEAVENGDVSAKIDLADKKSGQSEVDVEMVLSGHPDCWVAKSYKAIVNIEPRG